VLPRIFAYEVSTATCIEIGDLHEKMEEALAKTDNSPPPKFSFEAQKKPK